MLKTKNFILTWILHYLITSLDNIDFREWCELTCFTLNEPCAQGHNNWKLFSCARASVDQRDAATLLPIIYQYIRAGTTIYSDQWTAYNGIANGPGLHRYNHPTVNHSVNFVDPTTSTHTQNIENLWVCMKRKKKNQLGQHVTVLGTHLIEYMWRQLFGDRPFENLVRAIQEKYVVQ
ncbi:unnamed protein product [Rotaria socialis]|uniref:ISXO2-like transposase domain-containing protein n=1 Tax=Rotaria socialis TaxID=392032 RepID=A0A820S319_9BILA|nr:unnamed protein product [Rotaria socialis]